MPNSELYRLRFLFAMDAEAPYVHSEESSLLDEADYPAHIWNHGSL